MKNKNKRCDSFKQHTGTCEYKKKKFNLTNKAMSININIYQINKYQYRE